MNLKEIDALIKSIMNRGKKLREDSHRALIGIVEHYADHGDYTRIEKLQGVVGSVFGNSAEQAFVDWVASYVPTLTWDKDEGKFVHQTGMDRSLVTASLAENIVRKDKKGTTIYSGTVRDFSFFLMEKKKDVQPFNLDEALATLIQRAEKAYEKNVKEGAHNVVNFTAIKALKDMNVKALLAVKDTEETTAPDKKDIEVTTADGDKVKARA